MKALCAALLVITITVSAMAAKRLQSPKGKEFSSSIATATNVQRMLAPPPLPGARVTATLGVVVPPPKITTNRLTFWWQMVDEYHQRAYFGTGTNGRLYTNYTILQARKMGDTNWVKLVSTTGTNYFYTTTNAAMMFRLTAEWR